VDHAGYLRRLGFSGRVQPDLATLERLQRAHLTAVPFENLDIYHRRGVRTDDTWTVHKVVTRRRGGWCFELNGAFASLLTSLGFEVRRLAATVLGNEISPIPTHLTLEVTLDRPYLVDVGFGDSFIRPLPLDDPGPHDGGIAEFGFEFDQEMTTLISWEDDGSVLPHFRFDRVPRQPSDFDEASTYLQTHPGLRWTESRFATRLLDGGPDRVTLLTDRLKVRRDGRWHEEPVSEEDWDDVLAEWFDMSRRR